jgi:hypothetical protein
MFHFSIRDVLWLTVLVGVLVAWWIQHRLDAQARTRDAQEIQALKQQVLIRAVRIAPVWVPENWDYQFPPQRPKRLDPWPRRDEELR